MNNLAIIGPQKFFERSSKNNIYKLVQNTINSSWFKNAFNYSNRHYAMYNMNGTLVGFAFINRNHKNQRGDLRVRLIGTKKGQGYGRKLMEQIINNARNRGLKTVTLEAVPEARGFYNKIGFRPTVS